MRTDNEWANADRSLTHRGRYAPQSRPLKGAKCIELFGGKDWILQRHLSNIELGNNWMSIEKLMILATALEEDPVDLFSEIIEVYYSKEE